MSRRSNKKARPPAAVAAPAPAPAGPRTFALYPEERHWWSFADYGAVLDVVRRLKAKTVLEFGPGSSTLALLEGGATRIDTYETELDWYTVHQERLASKFPEQVSLWAYPWADPLELPRPYGAPARYDLALIDGPRDASQRMPVLVFALAHAKAVLIPAEDDLETARSLRTEIETVAAAHGRQVEWIESGPLAGGFALIGASA